MGNENVVADALYVEVRLGPDHLRDFFQWQREQNIYARGFSCGGPDGFFSGVFLSEHATKVREWLRAHGVTA